MVRVRPDVVLRVARAPELLAIARLTRLYALRAERLDLRNLAQALVILRADAEDGAASEAKDAFGDRPEEHTLHAAAAVCPDDDQIRVEVGRELDDILGRRAAPDVRDHVAELEGAVFDGLTEPLAHAELNVLEDLRRVCRALRIRGRDARGREREAP